MQDGNKVYADEPKHRECYLEFRALPTTSSDEGTQPHQIAMIIHFKCNPEATHKFIGEEIKAAIDAAMG